MPTQDPVTELQPEFSSDDAAPTDWETAREHLEKADVYWLSTVRPEGRPHVTPMVAVWLDGALYFSTSSVSERKAKNLAQNPHCALTTGNNILNEGLDLVIEGDAERVSDENMLQLLADSFATKYGEEWRGRFIGDGGNVAMVFKVAPATAFGFDKGALSQTRWRF